MLLFVLCQCFQQFPGICEGERVLGCEEQIGDREKEREISDLFSREEMSVVMVRCHFSACCSSWANRREWVWLA